MPHQFPVVPHSRCFILIGGADKEKFWRNISITDTKDPILRFRALTSLIHSDAFSSHITVKTIHKNGRSKVSLSSPEQWYFQQRLVARESQLEDSGTEQ
jgi:hypothetical protein